MIVVENFNNLPMAIVNYSVPEEVKAAFNRVFAGRNKSAVIAELMRRAVAESERAARREALGRELVANRARRPPATTAQLLRVRADRP